MIGLMTAVTCILGPLSLPLPFSPVPITLTNFAVFLSIYILGMKYGTISLLIYLALGTIGLPVFSSFSGGLGKLAGPTGGYLFGFIFLALIHGFLCWDFIKKRLLQSSAWLSAWLPVIYSERYGLHYIWALLSKLPLWSESSLIFPEMLSRSLSQQSSDRNYQAQYKRHRNDYILS